MAFGMLTEPRQPFVFCEDARRRKSHGTLHAADAARGWLCLKLKPKPATNQRTEHE
jgi:hypothetical protein